MGDHSRDPLAGSGVGWQKGGSQIHQRINPISPTVPDMLMRDWFLAGLAGFNKDLGECLNVGMSAIHLRCPRFVWTLKMAICSHPLKPISHLLISPLMVPPAFPRH